MKVSVVFAVSKQGGDPVGVFSEYEAAVEYCDKEDPGEKVLFIEEFEIDELVETKEK